MLDGLKLKTDELTTAQNKLGKSISDALSHGSFAASLRGQYQSLGDDIKRLTTQYDRLSNSMLKTKQISERRKELYGKMVEVGAQAYGVGMPIIKSIRAAANAEDIVRDISITGDYNQTQEKQLSTALRQNSLTYNQSIDQLGESLKTVAAGAITDVKSLIGVLPSMAKFQTAYRVDGEDAGKLVTTMLKTLQIPADDLSKAMNILASTTKDGAVEARDLAKVMPVLSSFYAGSKFTGTKAVAEISSLLQIAKKGAASPDEAANNLNNFLKAIGSQDTAKDFKKVGIDLEHEMAFGAAKGQSPVATAIDLIEGYLAKTGDGQKILGALKGGDKSQPLAENQAEMIKAVSQNFAMGKLFQDMQVLNALRALLQNRPEYKQIYDKAIKAGDTDIMDADFKKRMDTFNEQWKSLTNNFADMGVTIGTALLPSLRQVIAVMKPVVNGIASFIRDFPTITSVLIGVTAGIAGLRIIGLGLGIAFNTVAGTIRGGITVANFFTAALTRMSIAMRSATAASVVTGATTGATSMMTTGAALAAAGGGGLLAKIGLGKGGAIASLFGKANGIKGAGFIGTGLLAATVIPSIFDEDQSFGAKARSITELVAGIGGMLAGGAIGGVLGSALPGAGNVALGLAGGYGGYEIGSRGGGALYDGIFGTPTTKPANQYAIAEDPWLRGKSEQTATSTANAVKIENEAGVITLNYSPVVNIYGEATPENYRRQTEMLQRHKDDLIDMVQKSFDDMARRKQAAIGAS